MLKVKRYSKTAKLPTIAHPGEDIGYDLYADEDAMIRPLKGEWINTGISVQFDNGSGWKIETRGSFAGNDVFVLGGQGDAGYTGPVKVRLYNGNQHDDYYVYKGDKIAQLVEHPEVATRIEEVKEFTPTNRQDKGFGSSGKR